MKRAALALRELLLRDVGLEGGFLLLGTVFLAIGSSFINPAGPWLVLGGMCVLYGVSVAIPERKP